VTTIKLKSDASDGPVKHVIFIHGLRGSSSKTWKSKKSNTAFWPTWLSQDKSNIAVWSVDYPAPATNWRNVALHPCEQAQTILELLLLQSKLANGELVLIGHSLGGLVIKELIRLADIQRDNREDINNFLNRITKIVFIATPHTGSDNASLMDTFAILIRPSQSIVSLVKNNSNLKVLNRWYKSWARKSNTKHQILVENLPLKVFGLIVNKDSSDPGLPEDPIELEEDHSSICKPENRNSSVFKHISNFISIDEQSSQNIFLKSVYGHHFFGWHEYGNWSRSPGGIDEKYLIDKQLRVINSASTSSKPLSSQEGIIEIRNALAKPRSSIRLTGLSGVGKTRFAQALFDTNIGSNALDKSFIFYCDAGDSPQPRPSELAEKLTQYNREAIVIIDNCPPTTHRRLTSTLGVSSSLVSLITIEYDVREDHPENTEVYKLEPASADLIQKLIIQRFRISSQNARAIARFSGGNSRTAIALAETVVKGESISRLKDSELFDRLFIQKQGSNKNLLECAKYLSLLYSIEVDSDQDYSEEVTALSTL
jgi:predicted alpha/beta hydrolase family esterase